MRGIDNLRIDNRMELKWEQIHNGLERMSTSPSRDCRRSILRSLVNDARACGDPFSVMRILLSKRDRRTFNMKQSSLAECLVYALELAMTSKDGRMLLNWKTSAGSMSGDLSLLACKVISARQLQLPEKLSLSDVHAYLDKLSSSTIREERVSVLRDLIKHVTAYQMKWIFRLILRDMRIGVGEKMVLNAFHPDADDFMSFCVDLKQLCVQFASSSNRDRHQDVVVGKPLLCQHSKRMSSTEEAWTTMKGKDIVAECKFDGDRFQLHKDADVLSFWSRNGLKHDEYQINSIVPILLQGITSKRCVLDGELLVWDCVDKGYKSRTHNLNWDTARAERKGWESNDLISYVVFDILYEEDYGNVLHLPLCQRQELLKKIVIQDQPRFIAILPDEGSKWSIKPRRLEQLDEFFSVVVERGDEGVVLKDLGSKWTPNKRDDRWLKIKPDYLNLGADLDLLIIGGYYGQGEKACQLASYLLAVKDQGEHEVHPPRFLSACRCGGGLSEDEHRELQSKIGPYLMKNPKGGQPPSNAGYMVTENHFDCPDFWVANPRMSVVLQISSEKRVRKSHRFKTGYTFRFARVVRVRYDKLWSDCLSLQEFNEMIDASRLCGNTVVGKCKSLPASTKKKKFGRSQSGTLIPIHLQGRDLSSVVQKYSLLSNLVFYIYKCISTKMDDLTKRIVEAGGKVSLNLNSCVTHVLSSDRKELEFKASVASGRDVVNIEWLEECFYSSELLPISFRHYLHLSDATKERMRDQMDCYGDSYFEPITVQDLTKIFENMEDIDNQNVDILKVEQKYFGSSKRCTFRRIVLFLLPPIHSTNVDSQTIALLTLRRLSLEVCMFGAEEAELLNKKVTHAISFTTRYTQVSFKSIFRSMQGSGQQQLLSEDINVVSHLSLEESIQQKIILPVAPYSLRTNIALGDSAINGKDGSLVSKEETPIQCSPKKRQRLSRTPPSTTSLDQASQALSDSKQFSPRDSLDDFLQTLLPSLGSC